MKQVSIKPVINGFIVKVGCTEVVFDNTKKMLKALEKYISKPQSVEESYLDNPLNEPQSLQGASGQPIATVGTVGTIVSGLNSTNDV